MDLLFPLSSELYPNTSGIPLSICGKIRCLPLKSPPFIKSQKNAGFLSSCFPFTFIPFFFCTDMPPLTDTGTEYLLHICHPSKQNTTQKRAVHTDDGKQPNRQLRSLPCRELPLAANRINGATDSAPKIKIYKSGLLEKNFLFSYSNGPFAGWQSAK